MRPIDLDEVGSTNDWLRSNASGLSDGQWVFARRQTSGRGRLGRKWEMPEGNLAASCLVQQRVGEGQGVELGFLIALALYDAAAAYVEAGRLMLKWPNDVLLDGAKLSGILLEHAGDAVIVGVGVNLAVAPAIAGRRTVALADANSAAVEPIVFLGRLAASFEEWRQIWAASGFASVRDAWLGRAHPLGTPLTAHVDGGDVVGRFAGLDDSGALELAVAGGRAHRILAGDVLLAEGEQR